MALEDLQRGNIEPVKKALHDFWAQLDVEEEPAEIGTHVVIRGDWYYALGPRHESRFRDLLHLYRDITRSLPRYETQGPPDAAFLRKFEELVKEAAWVETVIRKDPEDEFQHGDFTIVPMPGVSRPKQMSCLAALDAAADLIRPKFPQVLYGKVFLSKAVSGGVATYTPDTIHLGLRASGTVGDVHALCHEFGHRYEHRFWTDKALKDAFWHLSTEPVYEETLYDRATRAKVADELMGIADSMRVKKTPPKGSELAMRWAGYLNEHHVRDVRPVMQRYVFDHDDSARDALWSAWARPTEGDIRVRTDKVVREPIHVTPYGKKSWKENFCEAFSLYVQGKALPPEVAEILSALR